MVKGLSGVNDLSYLNLSEIKQQTTQQNSYTASYTIAYVSNSLMKSNKSIVLLRIRYHFKNLVSI